MKKLMIIVMALTMMALPVFAWSEGGCENQNNITFPYADLNDTKILITLTEPIDFNSSDMFIVNGADDTRLNYALETPTRAWVEGNWTSANTTQILVYYNCSGTGGTSEQDYNTFMVNFSDTFDTDLSQWNMLKNASNGVMEILNDSHGDNILHMRGGSDNNASGFQFAETYQNVPLELQVDYDLGIFDSTAYTYGARTFFWGADDNLTTDFTNNFYFIWGTGYQNGFRFSQRINSTDINGDVQKGDLNSNAWNHYTLKFYKNITGDGYYYANVKTTGDVTYYNGNTEYTFTLGENFTDTGFRKYILFVNPASIDMWYDNLTIKYYAQEPTLSYSEESYEEPKYINWTLSPANESTNVTVIPILYFNTTTNYNTSRYILSGERAYLYDENGTQIGNVGGDSYGFGEAGLIPSDYWASWMWNYNTTYQWRITANMYDNVNNSTEVISSPTYILTTGAIVPTEPVISFVSITNYSIHQVRARYNIDVNTVRTADIECKDEHGTIVSGVVGDTVTTGGYAFICIFTWEGNFDYNTTYQWYITLDDSEGFHVETTKYDEYTTQPAPVPVIYDLGGTPALPFTAYSYIVEAGDTGSMTVTFLDSSDNVINGFGGTPCVFTGAVSIGNNTFTCNVPTTEDLSYSLYVNVTDVYGSHVESTHYSTFIAPQSVTGQVTAMTSGFVGALFAVFIGGLFFLMIKEMGK